MVVNVYAGATPMVPLASTGSSAYRVQAGATEARAVAMGGPYGAGKAIALGDSSGWLDENTDASGESNVKTADNLKLIARLFDW